MCETVGLLRDGTVVVQWPLKQIQIEGGGGGLDFSENLDKQKNKVLIMDRLCLTLQKKFGGVWGEG